MTKFARFVLLASALGAGSALANTDTKKDVVLEMDGRIYAKDAFPESCAGLFKGTGCTAESLGKFHNESKKEGDLVHALSTFTGPEGVQVIEESWEKDGHVQKAKIDNKVLGKQMSLEVIAGNKIRYSLTENGKTKTSDDDNEENLVVPSTLMSYIRPKFPQILAGEEIKIRMAVLDRQDAFTFIMKKLREEKSPSDEDILVLEMKPWSFIVKAAVSPLYFYLNPKTGEMFAFEGRSALRRKIDGKYKEMDSRVAYEYKINAFNLQKAKTSASNDALQTTKNCSDGGLLGTGKDTKCEVQSQ